MRYASSGRLWIVLALVAAGPERAVAQRMTPERFQDWFYYNNIGRKALERGDLEAASRRFRMAIDFARPAVASDPQPLARSYTDLALVLVKQGRAKEAEPLAEWALTVRERRYGKDSLPAALTLHVLALVASEQEQDARAESLLSRSLEIREKLFGPDDPQLVACLNDLGVLYQKQHKFAEAGPLFDRVLAMFPRDVPLYNTDRAVSLIGLASIFAAQGDFDRAASYDRQLLALLDRLPAARYPGIAGSLEPYIAQLRALGKTEEAGTLEAQARLTREGKNAAGLAPVDSPRTPRRSRAT